MVTLGEEDAKADYIRHNAEVKAHVPADKVRAPRGSPCAP